MIHLQKVVTQSRAEVAISHLATYVVGAQLQVGDRLPSERDMAQLLGISRPILREALKQLEALKIIESRTGSGTYLCKLLSPGDHHMIMQFEAERESLLHLLEVRSALESEAAALAACRATDEEIHELGLLVDRLEQEHFSRGHAVETDKAFHLALYRLSRNPMFLDIVGPIWEALEKLWDRPLGPGYVGDETLPLHRQTYECIRSRDAPGARQSIRRMLSLVARDLRVEEEMTLPNEAINAEKRRCL